MKKLQNNFTTPEQSKRLLELGVPADSADCMSFIVTDKGKDFFDDIECGTQIIRPLLPRDSYTKAAFPSDGSRFVEEPFPCWSVGRLIEILKECINNEDDLIDIFVELQYSNDILTTILMIFRDNKAILDFSKLEE